MTMFSKIPLSRRTRGMTLPEILIAMTLMMLVLAAGIKALVAGQAFTNHARMTTLASQVGQSVMEQLRMSNYAVISNYARQAQPVNFDSVIASEGFMSGFTRTMTVRVTFTELTASSSGVMGKMQATVQISWTENGVPHSRRTTTIFSEKGLSDYIYAGWNRI